MLGLSHFFDFFFIEINWVTAVEVQKYSETLLRLKKTANEAY
jgi:hypothetical protein